MFELPFRFPAFTDPLTCYAEWDASPPAAGGSGGDPPPPAGGDQGGDQTPTGDVTVADGAATGTPPPEPPKTDWRDRQIDKQHRKIKELEGNTTRVAELEAENQRLRELAEAAARGSAPPPAAAPPPPAAVAPQAPTAPAATSSSDPRVMEAQIRTKLQIEQMTERLKTDYPEETKVAIENFQKVGGLPEDVAAQLLATDDPAYVFATLGKDPSKIQDILEMSGARRQAALIKIGMEKAAPGAVPPVRPSGAPPPPAGISQRGSAPPPSPGNLYDDRYEFKNYYRDPRDPTPELAADQQWYAERQRQKRESIGRPWSRGGKTGAANA